MPWLKLLVAGLSPRRPGFAPGSAYVGFVVDKVAQELVFLRVLRFSPVNIIPPLPHTHLPPPHVVYNSPDQARYRVLGPKLGASFLTGHLAGTDERRSKARFEIACKIQSSHSAISTSQR
jgi:hypothetical protein